MNPIKQLTGYYGLTVWRIDDAEWAVGTEKQAERAALLNANENTWGFRSDWLVRYMPAGVTEKIISAIQDSLCEDAEPVIKAMLGRKLKSAMADAVRLDGRGHFLSPYHDGEEVQGEELHPKFKGKLAYKITDGLPPLAPLQAFTEGVFAQ